MLRERLKDFNIILASGSPRRQDFFNKLDVDFVIEVREIEEIFPNHLQASEITEYLARLKASAFKDLTHKDIVVTSDTIVWKDGKAVGKPKDVEDARRMLRNLSGTMHEVFTSVCFTGKDFQKTVSDTSKVWFKELTEDEIDYYITQYIPFDKAGSYGIQDWLGYIGIERLEGCFFNVMGLPTRLVYKTLCKITEQ